MLKKARSRKNYVQWRFEVLICIWLKRSRSALCTICLVVPCASTLSLRCFVMFSCCMCAVYVQVKSCTHISTQPHSTITNRKTTMSTYLHRIEQKLKRESNSMISFHSAMPANRVDIQQSLVTCARLPHIVPLYDGDCTATINICNCCWNEKNISHTALPSPTLL